MKYLVFLLFSFSLFGQATMPNNEYKLGDGASTAEKGFIFDTGDGAANVELKVDDSKALRFDGNTFQMGDGASVNDKSFILDPSSGAKILWDGTDSKLKFTNDGTNPKEFGTGGGAAGGEGYNNGFTADNNPNAESGLDGWSETGGGTLATTSTDPLELDSSFTFTPSAQNDYIQSNLLDFDRDIFKGRACQGQIEYVGGDENLSLSVVNGNGTIIATAALKAHTISAPESVFFLCPSATEIAGDALKGDLRLRIENTGATASPLIKWDKSYLGTLVGLSESTLPDRCTVVVDMPGTQSILSENCNGEVSVGSFSAGQFQLDYSGMGLTVAPAILGNKNGGAGNEHSTNANSVTTTSATITNYTSGGAADRIVAIDIIKQGADAKQSVQVYKSIPKVSENINEFSAFVSGSDVVSLENTNWIDGDCTNATTGRGTCNFVSGVFTNTPSCQVQQSGNGAANAAIVTVDNTAITWQVNIESGGATNQSVYLNCSKSEDDFKLPTVQPILVNQVQTSIRSGTRVESCKVVNGGGTPLAGDGCESWIDSYTDNSVGNWDLNIKSGIFSVNPRCTATVDNNNGICSTLTRQEQLLIRLVNNQCSTGAAIDETTSIICVGER